MLSIKLRQGVEHAFNDLLIQDPLTISEELLDEVLSSASSISTPTLAKGLKARNSAVRRRCLVLLGQRDGGTAAQLAQPLVDDEDPRVRLEALWVLMKEGKVLPDPRPTLIRSKPSWGIGFGSSRTEGEDEVREFVTRVRNTASDATLKADPSNDPGAEAFCILAARHIKAYRTEVHKRIIATLAELQGLKNETQNQLFPDPQEESVVKRLRSLVSVLTRAGDREDLTLVRQVVDAKVLPFSADDVSFFGRAGEWQDIKRLAEISSSRLTDKSQGLVGMFGGPTHTKEVVPTIVRLGRGRLRELVGGAVSDTLLALILASASDADFRALTDSTLHRLLKSDHTTVRKACALRCVKTLEKARIINLLTSTLNEATHYYNAVFWLDLGASLPLSVARPAATRELKAL